MGNLMHPDKRIVSRIRLGVVIFLTVCVCCTVATTLDASTRIIYFSAPLVTTFATASPKTDNTVFTARVRTAAADTNSLNTLEHITDFVESARILLDRSDAAKHRSAYQLWMSTREVSDTDVILEGNWQSCQESDGKYAERIYDVRSKGRHIASLHMGPGDEFALYKGLGPEGEDHEHTGPGNLLGTAFRVNDYATSRGKRNWNVPSLKLWVSIIAAGGSRPECESFFIRITRAQ